jgi:hypothetical protein
MSEKKEMRDKALGLLVSLMQAVDEIAFEISWENFEIWCSENNEEWGTLCLFDYMQREYYPKREKWCRCWREVNK